MLMMKKLNGEAKMISALAVLSLLSFLVSAFLLDGSHGVGGTVGTIDVISPEGDSVSYVDVKGAPDGKVIILDQTDNGEELCGVHWRFEMKITAFASYNESEEKVYSIRLGSALAEYVSFEPSAIGKVGEEGKLFYIKIG
jgi:hypothetical protein